MRERRTKVLERYMRKIRKRREKDILIKEVALESDPLMEVKIEMCVRKTIERFTGHCLDNDFEKDRVIYSISDDLYEHLSL